jgi:hypothetical protein
MVAIVWSLIITDKDCLNCVVSLSYITSCQRRHFEVARCGNATKVYVT